eukprot:TRINITY_DN4976_c0_g1_i4.p1 TRINITY_DN4976_c0_g1~~TRINITY_DN4976_c0_g1_i4.p1  ORF type:complete len:177 (+),score=13.39 TRINITY_DN4976_c0_g1_i4:54-533(+)
MPHSYGYRARTRKVFRREFRRHGALPTSTYLRTYKLGQRVDVVGTGYQQKGMPYKYYHGKTGVVWNITPRAIGVELDKRVRNRIFKKRIHVRIEHVRPSRCDEDFKKRVANNEAIRKANPGKRISIKRQPAQPEPAHFVSQNKGRKIETLTPQRYVLLA